MNKKVINILTILFLTIVFVGVCFWIGFTIKYQKPTNYAYYESDLDNFSVDWDDDKDQYDIFIFEENRHIFIPRSQTEIIICDDSEIIIEGKEYYNGRWEYKMYFCVYIDFEE